MGCRHKAGCYGLCGFAPLPSPPSLPCSGLPNCPGAVLLPGAGIASRGFRHRWHEGGGAETSWSLEGLESPLRPARASRRLGEIQKEQFTEKYSLSPFGNISEIKRLWVEAPKLRETPLLPRSLPENAQTFGHSRSRRLACGGDNFVVFNAVVYSVLVS